MAEITARNYRSNKTSLADLIGKASDSFGTMYNAGQDRAVKERHTQAQMEQSAADRESTSQHQRAMEQIGRQNAQTNEGYRKTWAEQQEQDKRLKLMELLGKGTAQKPLSVEQEKSEVLSTEGLDTADRLKNNTSANPNAARAVMASEYMRSIPLVGDTLGNATVGIGSLLNPKVSDIDADREKLGRNMSYLKSGATATDSEVRGIRRQIPGITASEGQAKERYDTFTAPFKQIKDIHANRGAPAAQLDPADAARFLKQGGTVPKFANPAGLQSSAPQSNGLTPEEQAELDLLRKELGQ